MIVRKQYRRFFVFLLGCLLLTGCSARKKNDQSLWIVTELSTSDGMNYQMETAVETFREQHPEVTLRLDVLPTEEAERETYLKILRAKIMAGDGPDVYLLPTGSELIVDSDSRKVTDSISVAPLFADVAQSMRSGIFLDISTYYDADTELNTQDLCQAVMEAGVVDGARYVLPIRYNMPIWLVATETESSLGISLTDGVIQLVQYALDTGNIPLAQGLELPTNLSAFANVFDYDKGDLGLSQEEIAAYLRLYQQWREAIQPNETEMFTAVTQEIKDKYDPFFHYSFEDVLAALLITVNRDFFTDVEGYLYSGNAHWYIQELPLYTTSLNRLLDNAMLKQAMGLQWREAPVTRSDGTVGAQVTYWGAVGSSCGEPELAYRYLRLLLTEDYQWDGVRPRVDKSNETEFSLLKDPQNAGLVEKSWPVQNIGAMAHFFDSYCYRKSGYVGQDLREGGPRRAAVKAISFIPDREEAVLQVPIDEVTFPVYLPEEESLSYALSQLNDEDGTPTDADIDKLAEKVYQNLWWHLAEG